MKNIVKAILFATVTSLITTPASAVVQVRYDRFKNSSSALAKIDGIAGRTNPTMWLSWVNDGPDVIQHPSSHSGVE